MTSNSCQRALCLITGKEEPAPLHIRFTFLNQEIADNAYAGQFVHVLPRNSQSYDPLLRRAFSIVSVQEGTFDVLFKIVGAGTEMMAQWQVGETVDLMGPLGKPFEILNRDSLLVGGGVGTPPMAMLASQIDTSKGQSIKALIGARTNAEVLCAADFSRYEIPVSIATDDGSAGHHGFVTELLKNELEASSCKDYMPDVYACGPLPMLRSVARICHDYEALCQVSAEENMPCGIGVCNGCVIPVLGQSDDYGSFRRICVDGPVAWAHEVDWARWADGASG